MNSSEHYSLIIDKHGFGKDLVRKGGPPDNVVARSTKNATTVSFTEYMIYYGKD
jgi:hypothetical protein